MSVRLFLHKKLHAAYADSVFILEIPSPGPPIIGGKQSYVPRYFQVDFNQFLGTS